MTSHVGLDKPVGLFCVKLNDGSMIYPLCMKGEDDGKYCTKLSLSFDEKGDWNVFMEDTRWQKFNHYNKGNATLIML